MQKTQFAESISGRSFVKRKEKKPLFCVAFTASFIISMIALVSYYCFASASDKGAEINAFGFILS